MFIVLTAILMISYAIIPVIAASAAPTCLHCVLQSGYTLVYAMICHDGRTLREARAPRGAHPYRSLGTPRGLYGGAPRA